MSDALAAIEDLIERSESNPENVSVDVVAEYTDHERDRVRRGTALVFKNVAFDEPERLSLVSEDLFSLSTDKYRPAQQFALVALAALLRERPNPYTDRVEHFVSLMESTDGHREALAADCFRSLAVESPDRVLNYCERLLSLLSDNTVRQDLNEAAPYLENGELGPVQSIFEKQAHEKYQIREIIAHALVEGAKTNPESLREHIETVTNLIDDSNDIVAEAAMEIVSELGRHDHTVPEETVSVVIEQVGSPLTNLQARAIRTLGVLGATRGIEPIEEAGEQTDDEDLETLANETATYLSSVSDDSGGQE